jgi:TPR repeat protein
MAVCPACKREAQEDIPTCQYCGVVFAKLKPIPASSRRQEQAKRIADIEELTRNKQVQEEQKQTNRRWGYGAVIFCLLFAFLLFSLPPGPGSNRSASTSAPSSPLDPSETGIATEGARQAAINAHWGVRFEEGQDAWDKGNHTKAFSIWSGLATEGYALAQVKVGAFYLTGIVVPRSDVVACMWFRKAAAQGFSEGIDSVKKVCP